MTDISRRRLLEDTLATAKAVALTGVGVGLSEIPGDKKQELLGPYSPQDKDIDWDRCAYSIETFGRGNIFFGDDHAKFDIRGMFARPEILKALHKNGVKHLCVEWMDYYQTIADDLWEGKIDSNKFVDEFNKIGHAHEYPNYDLTGLAIYFARMIIQANKHNIKFHFVDSGLGRPQDLSRPEMADIPGNVLDDNPKGWRDKYLQLQNQVREDFYKKERGITDTTLIQNYLEHTDSEEGNRMLDYYLKHSQDYPELTALRQKQLQWCHARVDLGNYETAKTIAQRVGNEKFAVMYGKLHLIGKNSLQAFLNQINSSCTTIDITANQEHKMSDNFAGRFSRYFDCADYTTPPDYTMMLDPPEHQSQMQKPSAEFVKRAQSITQEFGLSDPAPVRQLPAELFVPPRRIR